MNKYRYYITLSTLAALMHTSPLFAKKTETLSERLATLQKDEGYTVNFKDVTALEVVKFLSKIGNLNFIYKESDLQFQITMTSEGEASLPSVLSAFLQVIQVNGLSVIEDGKNIIIVSKEDAKSEIAPIFSDTTNSLGEFIPGVITRVFTIKNSDPTAVHAVISELLSKNAIVTMVNNTRKVIVTDVVINIDKVSKLLEDLDSPTSTLELKTYTPQYENVEQLEELLRQFLTPISGGNPVVLTTQNGGRTLYVMSTPFLVKEAMSYLKQLDSQEVSGGSVLVHKLMYQSFDTLKSALSDVVENMNVTGGNKGLTNAVKSMRYIKGSNSIVFTGSRNALAELKNLLANLDSESSKSFMQTQASDFFVYKLKLATEEQIESAIEHLSERLKSTPDSDPAMLKTLENAQYVPETHSVIFTGHPDVLDKIQALMPTLDVSPDESTTPFKKLPASTEFYIYHPTTHNGDALLDSLEEMGESLKESGLADAELIHTLETAKYTESSNTLLFTGSKASIDRIKAMLPKLDSESAAFSTSSDYYIYRPKGNNGEKLLESLRSVAKNLQGAKLDNHQLLRTLNNARYNSSTNSLIFTGNQQSIAEIKTLIPTVEGSASNVFLYKIQRASKSEVEDGLDRVTEGLSKDNALYEAVHSAKYLPASHSFAFHTDEVTRKQLQELLQVVDQAPHSDKSFRIIQLNSVSGKMVLDDAKQMVENLKRSRGASPALIKALESARYIPSTDSIYISGSPGIVDEAAKIIQGFDIPLSQRGGNGKVSFGLYKLTNSAGQHVMEEIREMIKHMKSSDAQEPALLQALESARYVRSSNAIYYTGTQEVIPQVREIIENFDDESSEAKKETYSMYKLKASNGEVIMEDLRKMRSNLHSSGIHDDELIKSLESARFISQTNSIYFTGTKNSIEEMNKIISNFDSPRIGQNTSYFMYHPIHGTPESLKQNMIEIAEELRASGLSDPTLINSIRKVKIIDSSDSLVFTGTPESIEEVKKLVQSVDNPQHQIKSVGNISFIVYKIQHTPANQLIAHARAVAQDLKASDSTDKSLIRTLESVRYIKESNSLVFTGTKATLEKAISLMSKFDGKDQSAQVASPEDYVIYKPVNMSGEELVQTLKDFQQNLVASGVDEDELYNTINNLRWMPRTSSILVSGNAAATKKVVELLKRFDVPGGGSSDTVDTVADSSFLIYKVQYHQGSDIEQALSGIAKDLATAENKERNKNLIEAINSLQWIEITNTIVGTGDSQTLARLRELLKNIDVPLKQVFIEVLVVETSSTDQLDFGLTWGSQGVYRNRLGYGFGAQPKPASTSAATVGSQFLESLQGINSVTKPKGSDIPLTSGGDLGVIGDIILHKGTSYFALGSLIRALQSDGDSTVVLNQKLITQDNKESTIFVGNNIPYAGSVTSTTQGGGTQQNTNLEYRDIGVNLSIKPTVGSDGVITLTLNQDISEEEEDLTGDVITTGQVNGIRTSKTTTQTRVTMPDNSFLAISGMIRNQTTHVKTGLPCLGGLPILGAAFSENLRSKKTQNVIVFLKPRIINSHDEYKDITTQQEDTYRSFAQPENFDAAIELVKTPDDD